MQAAQRVSQLIRTEDNLCDTCPASPLVGLDPLQGRGKFPIARVWLRLTMQSRSVESRFSVLHS